MEDRKFSQAEIVDDDRFEAREAISQRLGGLWWTFLLRGVLAAVVGIAALFWPTGSISLLLQAIGLLLVLDGGARWKWGRRTRAPRFSLAVGVVIDDE